MFDMATHVGSIPFLVEPLIIWGAFHVKEVNVLKDPRW